MSYKNRINTSKDSENKEDFQEKRKKLVRVLLEEGYIKTEQVRRAMITVPREEFIPKKQRQIAYIDRPLRLIEGQTISAPHMVAIICEVLHLKEGMKVLEIGTGFGYNAAVVSEVMNKKGYVYTIERIESLAKVAEENLKKTSYDKVVDIIIGDGTLGYEKEEPYDIIYGTASAPKIAEPLKEQLKIGGKLLIPMGESHPQDLILIEKESNNQYKEKYLGKVEFVPMIGKHGWNE